MIRGLMTAAASSRPRGDPAVRLLLHFDGSFADASTYGRVATVIGNPSASGSPARFGTSGAFDGSGDALTLDASATLNIPPTGDWTWEASVRFNAVSTAVLYQHAVGTGRYPLQVLLNSNGSLQARGFGDNSSMAFDLTGPAASAGVWYVLGVKRSGNVVSLWVNGTLQSDSVVAGALYGGDLPVSIGAYPSGAFSLDGQLDELRLSVGVTQDLSVVPTAPF